MNGKPRLEYALSFDDESRALMAQHSRQPRTLLSLCVTGQDARSLPCDIAIRLWHAPRPYIIRSGVDAAGFVDELVTDTLAYTSAASSFCNLDAMGFTRERLHEKITRDGFTLIARANPYATLVRSVVIARQYESFDPVVRRHASAYHCTDAPLVGSSYDMYTNEDAYEEAIDFIEEVLEPSTRRTVDALQPNIRVSLFETPDDDWEGTLCGTAHVTFRIYFVV